MVQTVGLLLLTLSMGMSVPPDKAVAQRSTDCAVDQIMTTGGEFRKDDGCPGRREGGGTR